MKIILLNTPNGEVPCNSIRDAEIKSMECTENIKVKVINEGNTIYFDFDPQYQGFEESLIKTREKIVHHEKHDEVFYP